MTTTTDWDWAAEERAYKDRLDDESWADQYLDDEDDYPTRTELGW